jgi:hypothetical protein
MFGYKPVVPVRNESLVICRPSRAEMTHDLFTACLNNSVNLSNLSFNFEGTVRSSFFTVAAGCGMHLDESAVIKLLLT